MTTMNNEKTRLIGIKPSAAIKFDSVMRLDYDEVSNKTIVYFLSKILTYTRSRA